MKNLTNVDKWEESRTVIKRLMFLIGSVYFSSTNVKGLYPRCADQLLSFRYRRVIEIEEREWTWIFTDNFNITYFLFTCALFNEGVIVSDYLVYIPNTPGLFTKTKGFTLLSRLNKFLKNLGNTSNFWAPVEWHKASFILRTHEY